MRGALHALWAAWLHRRTVGHLIRWDLASRFAGSLGGVLWAIGLPLVSIGVYILVFSLTLEIRMGARPGEGSFGVYLVAGLLPWLAMQDAVSRAATSLTDRRNLLLQVPIPPPLLPATIALSSLLQTLVGLAVFLLIACLYEGPSRLAPALALVIPVQLAMNTGLALVTSHLHAMSRDVGPAVQAALILWFFATPVVYPAHLVPGSMRWLVDLNPMVPIVEAYRDLILIGRWPEPTGALYATAFAAVVLGLGVALARAVRDELGEWI